MDREIEKVKQEYEEKQKRKKEKKKAKKEDEKDKDKKKEDEDEDGKAEKERDEKVGRSFYSTEDLLSNSNRPGTDKFKDQVHQKRRRHVKSRRHPANLCTP
jgi:AAA-ATPase Vps4-associated protein 1